VMTEKITTEQVTRRLRQLGLGIKSDLESGEVPTVQYKRLSKANVEFDLEAHSYELKDSLAEARGDRKSSLKKLAAFAFLARIAIERLEIGLSTTKRDYYYLQKSRHPLLIPSNQAESDDIIRISEVIYELSRESFGVIAQSKGYLYGDITLREPKMMINCLRTGGDGYSIPGNVEYIDVERADIRALVAIEKEGIYRNLMEFGIPENMKIGIAMLGGQPSRGMRRMLRKFSDYGVPIAIFTDLNPYSLRIAANIIYGSIQSAHISKLSAPNARFIGLETSDMEAFFAPVKKIVLEPMTEEDMKAAQDNASLPYMQGDGGYWLKENSWFVDNHGKTELEAFNALTKHAKELQHVYSDYLSRKIKERFNITL